LQQVAVWALPTFPDNEARWPDAQHMRYVLLYR
jgi:hypothetical protein